MRPPKVIFLDAVGTLFGVRGSVGEIYGKIANRYGVHVSSVQLDMAFADSFRNSPPLAFPGVEPSQIPQLEYDWWYEIAGYAFTKAGVIHDFSDFNAFFADLYDYFATAEPWFLYDEVITVLDKWRSSGIPLGIISNFDSRIYEVLKVLDIENYFTSVTISSMVGTSKPNPYIFHSALEKYDCYPEEAWHIGDSFQEDYQGAKAVGIKAYWLNRKAHPDG
ncbi:MAG: Phosphoglycolate phosphatase [Chroococcopsis gigantea SAG 12.99]|jgi:putative hydrolase of the HAD superfamily|nr:HAD-IA family hydrolase [Chlorogloea purpurea SAG 13.99]MDV3001437.1 Phosphoglycolate phosphatase [Chroococcopsis gigantea SAG 12.99]